MRPIFAVLASALFLSACTDTDWNRLTSFDSSSSEQVADTAPPAQVSAPSAVSPDPSFCQAIARQDGTGGAFDTATQTRVAQQSYAQCIALYSK